MAKGRLNNTEKYAIQGMLGDNMEISKIAESLGRSEKTIENYVNGELDCLHTEVAKVHLEKEENNKPTTSDAVKQEVFRRLRDAGLTDNDAKNIIQAALKKGRVYKGSKGEERLYTDCIKKMKAGNFMIKKTQGGKEGVAIMTQAAATKMDDAHKRIRNSKGSRATRQHLFDTEGNQLFDDE